MSSILVFTLNKMFSKKKSGAEYKKIREAKKAEAEKTSQKLSKFFGG